MTGLGPLTDARFERRPTMQPDCPHCDEPLREARTTANHDRPGLTYRRCGNCGHEQDHVVERESEADSACSFVLTGTLSLFREDGIASDLISELHACLGVDLQISHAAIDQELVRLNYGSDDLDSMLRFQLALSGLQCLHELGVRPGQRVRILHDFENARIILSLVPGQSHSADLHARFSVGSRTSDGETAGRIPQECDRLAGAAA